MNLATGEQKEQQVKDRDRKQEVVVWRRWDDGYLVRSMTLEDVAIVQKWYLEMGVVCRKELRVCLEVFPPGPGFYIGEKDGEVVATTIRIPWGNGVYFGFYYYVAQAHWKYGYGTRLRDQVAKEHVGDNILCIDAVFDHQVAERNRTKFGYEPTFLTTRYTTVAKEHHGIEHSLNIVKATDVPFESLMSYDNKHFVSTDFTPRKEFMRRWISLPGGASYVAIDDHKNVIGLCCRHRCITQNDHQIGPLYADSPLIAEALLQRSCRDVVGQNVNLYCWSPNIAASEIVRKFEMSKVFDLQRMRLNGDAHEYKDSVYGVTSIDVCGF